MFRHADGLVEIFEYENRKAFHLDGFVLKNTNPLMIMVLATDILTKIKKRFRSLSLRIEFISEQMHEGLHQVMQNIYRPREIEMMLKQEDIRGNSVLAYISWLKLYHFLQINHVNRIVNQMWESKTDIGGSVFDLSTTYYLTFTNKLRYLEDNELRKRFYAGKNA